MIEPTGAASGRAALLIAATAAVALAGCSRAGETPSAAARGSAAPEPAPAPEKAAAQSTAAAESCQARADELAGFLTAMDHEPSFFVLGEDLRLISRVDLSPATGRAPLLEVTLTDARFAGQIAPDATALAAALGASQEQAQRARQAGYGGPDFDPARIHIAVDERAPWSAVVAATTAAFDAGFSSASFVFARPPATEPPPRSPIDDQLDAIERVDPSARAAAAARILEGLVARCSALQRLFGQVAAAEDKAAFLLAGVGPALVECDCQVDIPSLRSALWRVLGNPRPLSIAAVPLARDGERLTFPADTPWAEAAEHIGPGAAPTWLAVTGAP